MYLFIDTSNLLTVGLLDSDFKWIEYQYIETKKSSTVIHKIIHEQLSKNNLDLSQIVTVFACFGPGSYTGLRVTKGITDIFKFENIQITSFYHFEVPLVLGVESGVFVSQAFKGEFFHYIWNLEENSMKLLPEIETSFSSVWSHEDIDIEGVRNTQKMIYQNSEKIFRNLPNNLDKDIFYYRSLEDEFGKKNEK